MLARLAPEPVRVTISRRDAAGGGRCAVYAAVPVEVRVENIRQSKAAVHRFAGRVGLDQW